MRHHWNFSRAGRLLTRVLELDVLIKRYHLGLDEITMEEHRALNTLDSERSNWMMEDAEAKRKKAEMERRMREASERAKR
jgi:hypothetical protein